MNGSATRDAATKRGDAKGSRWIKVRLLALFCAFAPLTQAEQPAAPAALSFLRTTERPGKVQALETLSAEYRPASGTGPSVWLVGVAHLGTAEYYQAVQQRLARQTVVLYEGVGMHDVTKAPGAATETPGLQSALARALGLKFQLEAIDYRGPNFVNSDLKVPDLEAQIEDKAKADGGNGSDAAFDQLIDALQGTGVTGSMFTSLVGVLGSSPQLRETAKLVLISALGQAGEMLEMAKRLSPQMKDLLDVLITQRNAIVLRDLRAQLGQLRAGQSVAIFYGAAHMDEIAQRLQTELHYQPVNREWNAAFTADSAQSGISPVQIGLMLEMLKTQLRQTEPARR